jgi:hypothetical protein
MTMHQMYFSQLSGSKSSYPVGHKIGARAETPVKTRINSVFLSNRYLSSKVNWQAELLKLEDAS